MSVRAGARHLRPAVPGPAEGRGAPAGAAGGAAVEAAAAIAKALADPTRLTVAAALRDGGELCVCDLAWVCERSDKLVSHHVRQLRAAGLVRSRRDGKMVLYALTPPAGHALLGSVLPLAAV